MLLLLLLSVVFVFDPYCSEYCNGVSFVNSYCRDCSSHTIRLYCVCGGGGFDSLFIRVE